MSEVQTFAPPVLEPLAPGRDKWSREYEAFLRLLPGLLATGYRGQYVAVHDGRVVGHGPDKVAVAMQAYRTFGPVPILVRLVTDEPPRVVHIPSPKRTGPEPS